MMDSKWGGVYQEQGDGNFSQEVWRLVSILIEDGHHQNIMNVFDRAAINKVRWSLQTSTRNRIRSQFVNLQ